MEFQYDEEGQIHINPDVILSQPTLTEEKIANNILSQVMKSTISPDGPMEYENEKILLPLKPHQRRAIAAMRRNETLTERISPRGNFSFYSDNVGAGKSLALLALIAKYPLVGPSMVSNQFTRFAFKSNPDCVVGFVEENNKKFSSSLILVPHTIIAQWEGYIKRFTKLRFLSVKSTDALKKITLDDIESCEVVLCKSTLYLSFLYLVQDLTGLDFRRGTELSVNRTMAKIGQIMHKSGEMNLRDINDLIDNLKKLRTTLTADNEVPVGTSLLVKNRYMFQRVIVDEACDIRIRETSELPGYFVWYVSSSVQSLITNGNSNNFFSVKHMIGKPCWAPYWPRLVIRNDEEFVKQSFDLPPYNTRIVRCLTPQYMRVLHGLADKNIITKEALDALSAGDVYGAMSMMGCEVTSEEDIIESIVAKFRREVVVRGRHLFELDKTLRERQINRTQASELLAKARAQHNEAEIAKLTELRDSAVSLVASAEESIRNEKEHIAGLEQKIKDIKDRLDMTSERQCPICIGDIENPTVTPCCKNLFCGACLFSSLTVRKSCPLCRQDMDLQQVKAIQKGIKSRSKKSDEAGPAAAEEAELPTKMEALFNILGHRPDGRYLIFTDFDQVFTSTALITRFATENIKYDYLKGTGAHVANTVERFNSGKLKVLILNARYLGSGINLQSATDTIIFHRLGSDIEKQVIGRGQRPGRTEPLTVHYLYYDNELHINQ
jgi:SNF2 family DNA or RNA helicase